MPAGSPARTFTVTVGLAGQERSVTVRAYPQTGGEELAHGAKASSSGGRDGPFPGLGSRRRRPEDPLVLAAQG
ncbi:hypothetical protein GCM10020000_54110 [Streptomyces olivoverticillatus]